MFFCLKAARLATRQHIRPVFIGNNGLSVSSRQTHQSLSTVVYRQAGFRSWSKSGASNCQFDNEIDHHEFEHMAMAPGQEEVSSNDITCTVFDEHGNVTAVCKKIKKKDFLSIDGLHPRDLRHIDNAQENIIPSILVRPRCILVNMLDIRAVVSYNKVLVLDSATDRNRTSRLGLFVYDLENKLRSTSTASKSSSPNPVEGGFVATQPYEMKALESILMNTVTGLDIELKSHLAVLNDILQDLEDHVDRELLRELLVRNKSLSRFCQKCLLIRNVINDVLDNDEDLVGLYLTERHNGLTREDTDHAEAELLLEAYYKLTDEIVRQAEQVLLNIKSTEEIINIMLDSNRNSLMLMELKITIGTLGFTACMFIASLYGMNLKNYMEDSPFGMVGVTVFAACVGISITWFNLRRLSSIKKVTMGGSKSATLPGIRPDHASFGMHSHQKKHLNLHGKKGSLLTRWFRRSHLTPQQLDPHSKTVLWRWLSERKHN